MKNNNFKHTSYCGERERERKEKKSISYKIKMEKTLMVSVKEESVLNTGKKDSAIEGEKERERRN